MVRIGPNVQTTRNTLHDITLEISTRGINVALEATSHRWTTSTIDWDEWDRMVAWVEWRRKVLVAESKSN